MCAAKTQRSKKSKMSMNSIKCGDYLMMCKHQLPCKVTKVGRAEPGKHGHAQFNIDGINVLTGKKCNDLFKSHEKPVQPEVTKKNIQCAYIDEQGYMSLIDDVGKERTDLRLTTEEDLVKANEYIDSVGEFIVNMIIVVTPEKDRHEIIDGISLPSSSSSSLG